MPFKDKEVQKTYMRKYNQKYYESCTKTWRQLHPEKVKESQRKYLKKHGKELNKRWREYKRLKNLELRHRIIELLGGKCAKCGIDDVRVLQIDHVNGSGNAERGRMCPYSYYKCVLKSIEANEHKYQLLCANCNWIKRYETGENPLRLSGERLIELVERS